MKMSSNPWIAGFLSWLLPFVISCAFFMPDETGQVKLMIPQPLFKSLMVVIGSSTGTWLLLRVLRGGVGRSASSGFFLGVCKLNSSPRLVSGLLCHFFLLDQTVFFSLDDFELGFGRRRTGSHVWHDPRTLRHRHWTSLLHDACVGFWIGRRFSAVRRQLLIFF
jgi:hypothetical protein